MLRITYAQDYFRPMQYYQSKMLDAQFLSISEDKNVCNLSRENIVKWCPKVKDYRNHYISFKDI